MRTKVRNRLFAVCILLAAYIVFTLLVRFVDVQAVGPENSSVGFARLNSLVFNTLGGYHAGMNLISKLFGMLILLAGLGAALIAVLQFVRERSIRSVDADLLAYICYGIVVLILYVVTSKVSINYRPVILDVAEGLKKSYPSSHTLLAVSVTGAFAVQLRLRVRGQKRRRAAELAAALICAAAVVTRLAAGVHWFTDIIGAVLLGTALAQAYRAAVMQMYDWMR